MLAKMAHRFMVKTSGGGGGREKKKRGGIKDLLTVGTRGKRGGGLGGLIGGRGGGQPRFHFSFPNNLFRDGNEAFLTFYSPHFTPNQQEPTNPMWIQTGGMGLQGS